MSERHTNPSQDELDAIQAELEALGEELSDDLQGELAQSEWLSAAVERPLLEAPKETFDALGALRLHSPAGQLSEERSEMLLGGLEAMLAGDGVSRELKNVGELPASPAEQRDARVVGQVLDAWRKGPDAVDGLETPSLEQQTRLEGPLTGLHLLRTASPEAELAPERAEVLWEKTRGALPDRSQQTEVIDLSARFRRNAVVGTLFAAAAAVFLVCAGGILFEQGTQLEPTSTQAVAQVELVEAEAELARVEADALKTLLAARNVKEGQEGDHYLRTVRLARHRAIQARAQARERRL